MKRALIVVLALALVGTVWSPALAQDKVVKFGFPADFTKVYTFITEEWIQGSVDYLQYVNLKGGVGGYKLEWLITDHGNEPQRGIEAYERFKREGATIFDLVSTPVSRAVLPRALKDNMIVVMPFHGRSDVADGSVFTHFFSLGANYWSQAAAITKYTLDQEGGNLKGKKLALVHIDSPFGKEPIPVFEELSKRLGFELGLFPYPSPGNEQSATWTQVRRFRPDWTILWGAGVGQPVSIREALRNGMSLERVISVIWVAEKDMQVVGAQQARGLLRFEAAVPGRDTAIIQGILSEVYQKAGKGHGKIENVGTTYYVIGINAVAPVVEGIRIAREKFGEPVTTEKIRQAMETLRNFDEGGLIAPITLTPKDHEGGGFGRISQWDGTKWVPKSGWFNAYREIVWDLVKKSAEEFQRSGK
jgi:branched-chain amino acid transport system substrate-binding protein